MKEYYLINNYDGNDKIDIDTLDCPIDGQGNVDEKDAAFAAIEQLGWMFCIKDNS